MPTKSHTHEIYGTLRKFSICTKGYDEIHIQTLAKTTTRGIRHFDDFHPNGHLLGLKSP
jgi:hypothetical protein